MAKYIKKNKTTIFNQMMVSSIASAILTGIIGCILFFVPELTNKVIGYIIGGIFLLYGIDTLLKYFKRDGAKLFSYSIVFGLLFLLLGLFIIIMPYTISAFVTVVFGIYLILMGGNKISCAVALKIGNHVAWLITLFIGILLITFGLLVITNPFASFTITKLIGVFLILSSILELTDAVLLRRRNTEIVKIFW